MVRVGIGSRRPLPLYDPFPRMNPLVVEQVCVRFPASSDWRGKPSSWIHAVEDVSFSIAPRETVGLVGESGCGKSTLGRAIVGLQSIASGRVRFNGQIVAEPGPGRHGHLGLQMVFQDPYSSLNPNDTSIDAVSEVVKFVKNCSIDQAEIRSKELLSEVGFDLRLAGAYPHEMSGGQRQRLCIARALASDREESERRSA
jgi:ABC-type glutathione transport system ATPase component